MSDLQKTEGSSDPQRAAENQSGIDEIGSVLGKLTGLERIAKFVTSLGSSADEGLLERQTSRRGFFKAAIATAALGEIALSGCSRDDKDKIHIDSETGRVDFTPFPQEAKLIWDKNRDFLREYHLGRMPEDERQKRIERLDDETFVFHDVRSEGGIGVSFYKVQPGDSKSAIIEKLSRHKEFAYLSDLERNKLLSFNIPSQELRAGAWLPIPLEPEKRRITDEQFFNYCFAAIQDMTHDPIYGRDMARVLDKVRAVDLMALMMATAKQEAGGKPLGQFVLHRWEPEYQTFSYSYFHVLMDGPGELARKRLGVTEGQMYHPQIASKVFLAFLIEKGKELNIKPEELLPFEERPEHFAAFFNGSDWATRNPYYVTNTHRFYSEALNLLESGLDDDKTLAVLAAEIARANETRSGLDQTRQSGFIEIGGFNLFNAIREANQLGFDQGLGRIIKADPIAEAFAERIQKFLVDSYGDSTYQPTDQIAVGEDERGIYVIYKRNSEEKYLRLKQRSLESRLRMPSKKQAREISSGYFEVHEQSFESVIENANWKLRSDYGKRVFHSNQQIQNAADTIRSYLEKQGVDQRERYDDEIAVCLTADRGCVSFKRRGLPPKTFWIDLSSAGTPRVKDNRTDYAAIGDNDLRSTILDRNWQFKKESGAAQINPLKSDRLVNAATKAITDHVQQTLNSRIAKTDQIAVGVQDGKAVVFFKRNNREQKFIIH